MRRAVRLFATPLPAILMLAALALGGGGVAAIKATEKPSFCATCHEMAPYRDAWAAGAHKDVSCVACHVDPGTTSQLTHKVSALKEVYDHFASRPKFPRGDAAVPDARCLACHKDLPTVTKSGFKHARHLKQGKCVDCHDTVGHKVSPEALRRAGVLSTTAVTASSAVTTGTHVPVNCSRCHNLIKTACETCHTSRHTARGTCTTCHAAGVKWAFAHPAQNAACTTCHERPKIHFAGTCTTCHELKTAFAKTVYKHTDPACTTCHAQPAAHRPTGTAACTTCHQQPGRTWAFTHPASAACGSCHRRPASHFTGRCANCHTPRVPFAATTWRHSSSTTCQTCHQRPSGHRSGTCATCHKQPGRTWAFSHPSSSSCSSCHKAPSSHFGTNCASCHKPGRAWTSASFNHPATQHSWKSMACSNCHPSGPPKVGCTCHGGGPNGPAGG